MSNHAVAGIVLAGGRSRRMGGGEKALCEVGGLCLLDRVITAARCQVGPLALSVNSETIRSRAPADLPMLADSIPDFAGPLAGILAGMEWLRSHAPEIEWLASFPVDAPLFPTDLVTRLLAAVRAEGADLACAASGGRRHPVFGLWPTMLAPELRRAMVQDSARRIGAWAAGYRLAVVEWPCEPIDPFHNVNTPEDVASLRALLAEGSGV